MQAFAAPARRDRRRLSRAGWLPSRTDSAQRTRGCNGPRGQWAGAILAADPDSVGRLGYRGGITPGRWSRRVPFSGERWFEGVRDQPRPGVAAMDAPRSRRLDDPVSGPVAPYRV